MYLLTPPNGLLSQYMQTNAINFANLGPDSSTARFNTTGRAGFQSISPMRGEMPTDPLARTWLSPLTFQLTLSSLSFLKLVFDLPEKFTKYAFI